jgi:hypothetical protein
LWQRELHLIKFKDQPSKLQSKLEI